MGVFSDLTGRRFGFWTVTKYAGKYKFGGSLWECACNCGTVRLIRSRALNKGHTKSCGCLAESIGYPSKWKTSSFYRGTQLWYTYNNIKKRCENEKSAFYYCYGGRGIKCEWTSFDDFLKDMEKPFKFSQEAYPGIKLSIDRMNVDGNYNNKNCRWIPLSEQSKNTRSNVRLTYDGMTLIASEWCKTEKCRSLGINRGVIMYRKKLGWSDEKILTTKVRIGNYSKK